MTGCQHPVTSTEKAEVAVGALTGIAPDKIMRFALIVLDDDDDDLHMVTSCCKDELPELVTRAGLITIADAMTPGPCEHGGGAHS